MDKLSLFFIFAILLLSSACSRKTTPIYITTIDSTRVEVRETTITVVDTAYITIPEQSIKQTVKDSTSFLETDFATSTASILPDGSLFHELKNKPHEVPVEVENKIQQKDSIVYKDRVVVKEVPVEVEKELSWWGKIKQLLGGIAIVAIVIYLALTFIRLKRNC